MKSDPPDHVAVYPPIACEEIVYRLARSRNCIDPEDPQFTPAAFLLRPDEDGLSVNPVSRCTLAVAS